VPSYELQYQFLPENKFLKTEFVTRFHHFPYDEAKGTILQDCVKKMLQRDKFFQNFFQKITS